MKLLDYFFELQNVIFPQGNNVCFYGDCKYYCDTGHPVCGRPDILDGSLCAWLPDVPRYRVKSPWRRSYSKVCYDTTTITCEHAGRCLWQFFLSTFMFMALHECKC